MKATYFVYPALALVVGCGAEVDPQVEASATVDEQQEQRQGAIPEYQLKALEDARKVEGQLQESLEKRTEPVDQE